MGDPGRARPWPIPTLTSLRLAAALTPACAWLIVVCGLSSSIWSIPMTPENAFVYKSQPGDLVLNTESIEQNDFATANAVLTVVRVMRSGECPRCSNYKRTHSVLPDKIGEAGWECAHCGFFVSENDFRFAHAFFTPYLKAQLNTFQRFRDKHRNTDTPTVDEVTKAVDNAWTSAMRGKLETMTANYLAARNDLDKFVRENNVLKDELIALRDKCTQLEDEYNTSNAARCKQLEVELTRVSAMYNTVSLRTNKLQSIVDHIYATIRSPEGSTADGTT